MRRRYVIAAVVVVVWELLLVEVVDDWGSLALHLGLIVGTLLVGGVLWPDDVPEFLPRRTSRR